MDPAALSDPAFVAVVAQVLADGRVANYGNISSLCLMIYDYLLSFQLKYRLVWKAPWTPGKCIFVSFRYCGLAFHAFDSYVYVNTSADLAVCARAIKVQTAFASTVMWGAEVILAARVWILYGKSMRILILLIVVFMGGLTTMAVLDGLAYVGKITGSPFPPPFGSGCDTIGAPLPHLLFVAVIPPTITTTILFILTLFKTSRGHYTKPVETPTLSLIHWDGIRYFGVTFAVMIVNTFIFRYARLSMKGSASGFLASVPWTVACRMMLNIRSLILGPKSIWSMGTTGDEIELSRRSAVAFHVSHATDDSEETL
ncbi:hypothetical protein SISSUDRAFT_1124636 [Sistotremastrum suecicum HHB10207 ss-3]|uniref:DUF6533 domain-containing protein n=1 Tax=Sistotremastrum suecicum HHB10207 ss-3 TaxID=1314776 RepID=A0A166I7T4_9AGAM|nr:hypothetical protein SISSUDRAFT_1124636 [Sistotremastrum suecicum HHB10207 ss-3]